MKDNFHPIHIMADQDGWVGGEELEQLQQVETSVRKRKGTEKVWKERKIGQLRQRQEEEMTEEHDESDQSQAQTLKVEKLEI